MLREQDGKIPSSLRSEIEGKIEALKKEMEGNDLTNLRNLTDGLDQLISRAMQQAAQPDAADSGNNDQGSSPTEEDVIEGEFQES